MDLIEVRLGNDEQHFAYIRPISVWLALPHGKGATRLYLTYNMETVYPPQQLSQDTPDSDLLLALFRWRMTEEIGTVLTTPATFAEVMAACPDLVHFTARGGDDEFFPIGLRGDLIDAITPAYDKDGQSAGGNITMRRVCIETDGRMLPVMETPDEILRRLGWQKPTVTIGRVDRIITDERRIITPGNRQ